MKRFRTIALTVLVAIPVLLAVIVGLTQTRIFRERLRAAALTELDSLVNGRVSIGRLGGDLITGFTLDSIAIEVDGGPLVRIPRLEIAYNFFALPGKTIAVRRLTLMRPEITLYRPAGGAWNLSDLLRQRPPDTAAGKPFDWVVDVRRLEILDGTLTLIDSAALTAEGHTRAREGAVEYHDIALREINLVASANIARDNLRAVISSCAFSSSSPDFRLKMLCGVFSVTPWEARADSMRIITGKSRIALNASLKDVNLFAGLSLRRLQSAPVDLALQARPIDMGELSAFLPPLDFLAGAPEISVQAGGPFGDLAVRQLDVRFGRSSLAMRGALTNLHDPRRLALNVKVTESTVDGSDVLALLPGLDLPDLTPLGTSTLNLEYEGVPLDFRTKFLLETEAGDVSSSGLRLTVGGPSVLAYDGSVAFRHLNLARALDDDGLRSNLNGLLTVKGSGVALRRLSAAMGLAVDTSTFRGLPLRGTRVNLTGAPGKLGGQVSVSLGAMRANLAGEIAEAAAQQTSFRVEGDVSSLDLSTILHDTSFSSDITMKLKAEGSGLTWGSINGDATVDLSSSRYRDYTLDQGAIHVALDQRDSSRKALTFESNVADLSLTGVFDLKYLVDLIRFEAVSLRSAVAGRIALVDPSFVRAADKNVLDARGRALLARPRRLDASYVLNVKDLGPLSAAAGSTQFDGTGVIRGSLRGGYGELALGCDVALDDFSYGTSQGGILVEDGRAKLDITTLRPGSPLAALALRLEAKAGRLLVNRNTLDSLDIAVNYGNERATYAARSSVNTDYRIGSSGNARVDENSFSVTESSLDVAYRDFAWKADPGAMLRVSGQGAAVDNLVFRRDSQSVALDARLGAGQTITASAEGRNLDLEGLKHLLGGEEAPGEPKAFTGTARFSARGSGTLADPAFSATVHADSVTFRSLPFGGLTSNLEYSRRSIEAHVRLEGPGMAPGSAPIMTVDGTLPVDLRFVKTGGDSALPPMNLRVLSRGMQINVLEPLLHTFNDLSGIMTCDLTLTGTLGEPSYAGTLTLSDCSFLFMPNNIRYTLNGTFAPEGERIRVVDCVIRNVKEDVRAGREGLVHMGGDFSLRNLRPGDFDLTATGKLLVVKESTERSSLAVYGDLFVEIGPGPLHFTGEIENSLLKGSLSVRNSSLIFPPTQSRVTEESPESVRMVFVDDTLHVRNKPESPAVSRYFAEGAVDSAAAEIEHRRSKSFMDGLRYDLDIDATGGNTEIRMIFNPVTSEELDASLDGRFTITGDGTRWTGDLSITRAYYNFFKRFDATGSIRYTGDFLNPELNISATYQGTRTLDTSATIRPQEKVVVTVKITGTRREPKVEFGMTINDIDYYTYTGPTSHDLQSDAISFIVAGTFPLNVNQERDVANQIQSTAGYSLATGASSVLTGQLSQFLKNQGLDVNVELNVNTRETTELRLSGTALSGYWHYGGTILNDPLANANISILYSLGTIFDSPSLRNLMLELERRVEPGVFGVNNDLKRINSARMFYRFSF